VLLRIIWARHEGAAHHRKQMDGAVALNKRRASLCWRWASCCAICSDNLHAKSTCSGRQQAAVKSDEPDGGMARQKNNISGQHGKQALAQPAGGIVKRRAALHAHACPLVHAAGLPRLRTHRRILLPRLLQSLFSAASLRSAASSVLRCAPRISTCAAPSRTTALASSPARARIEHCAVPACGAFAATAVLPRLARASAHQGSNGEQ